jgi:hypothetical protein
MAKLTNKYDVVQMGDTPDFLSGLADRLEQYIDPKFQRQLSQDRENKRRYNKEQESLIAQRNYESDVSAWEDAQDNYNTMISAADNPSQIKIINKFWADRDKTYNIRNTDGTVDTKTLDIGVYNSIADEEITRKNAHKVLRDEYLNPETTRERRVEMYSQLRQTGLDAGMAIDPSIDSMYKEDRQYQSNKQLVDYITSADYLQGTGISVEEADALKEQLAKGGISDAELGILNDFVSKRIKDERKTRDFWEKLYNKSLETYGKTKFETPPLVRQKLRKLMEMAEKQLEFVPEQSGNQGNQGKGTIDIGSLTEEEINKYNKAVENRISNKDISDEERISIEDEVYASMFPSMSEGKTPSVNQTAKDSGDWFDLTNIETRSKQYAVDVILNEDDLQIRGKNNKITNPFMSERDNMKVLRDPVSGKAVNRDTLLKNMKENPRKYAAKGYVYDPRKIIEYVDNTSGPEPVTKQLRIGYKKMSPKLALQMLNTNK